MGLSHEAYGKWRATGVVEGRRAKNLNRRETRPAASAANKAAWARKREGEARTRTSEAYEASDEHIALMHGLDEYMNDPRT
jgi:hypothetical protein